MITTTHIVTNVLVSRNKTARASRFGRLFEDSGTTRAFVIGGFAPDLGLYLLTLGAAIYYPLARDMEVGDALQLGFDDLFFNDPLWIVGQNTLHSPVVVFSLAVLAYLTDRARLLSFSTGALLHIAIDIPVHHDDGPLVLFPFDWSTRLASPVSYWDPDHFGNVVGPVDLAITVVGGAYLIVGWWKRR